MHPTHINNYEQIDEISRNSKQQQWAIKALINQLTDASGDRSLDWFNYCYLKCPLQCLNGIVICYLDFYLFYVNVAWGKDNVETDSFLHTLWTRGTCPLT